MVAKRVEKTEKWQAKRIRCRAIFGDENNWFRNGELHFML
jgi:hypothetical protein